MAKHIYKMVVTREEEWGYKSGYCEVCFSDMADNTRGKITHYNSHENAIKLGLWGKGAV